MFSIYLSKFINIHIAFASVNIRSLLTVNLLQYAQGEIYFLKSFRLMHIAKNLRFIEESNFFFELIFKNVS